MPRAKLNSFLINRFIVGTLFFIIACKITSQLCRAPNCDRTSKKNHTLRRWTTLIIPIPSYPKSKRVLSSQTIASLYSRASSPYPTHENFLAMSLSHFAHLQIYQSPSKPIQSQLSSTVTLSSRNWSLNFLLTIMRVGSSFVRRKDVLMSGGKG